MDIRDRHLNRHMQQRMSIGAELPPARQRSWARKCMDKAASQHRTAFYLMANLWLANIRAN